MYIAEEDTLDECETADCESGKDIHRDGFVSVFDINNNYRMVKRFRPGFELPDDFTVAHGLAMSLDQKFMYVSSYMSHYIIKIDTTTDTVVKVFGPDDNLLFPHGGYVSGSIR